MFVYNNDVYIFPLRLISTLFILQSFRGVKDLFHNCIYILKKKKFKKSIIPNRKDKSQFQKKKEKK